MVLLVVFLLFFLRPLGLLVFLLALVLLHLTTGRGCRCGRRRGLGKGRGAEGQADQHGEHRCQDRFHRRLTSFPLKTMVLSERTAQAVPLWPSLNYQCHAGLQWYRGGIARVANAGIGARDASEGLIARPVVFSAATRRTASEAGGRGLSFLCPPR